MGRTSFRPGPPQESVRVTQVRSGSMQATFAATASFHPSRRTPQSPFISASVSGSRRLRTTKVKLSFPMVHRVRAPATTSLPSGRIR